MSKTRAAVIPLALAVAAGTALAHPTWFTVTTVTPPPGYTGVMYPKAINDLGQVVATGNGAPGEGGFIWLPTPAYGYPAGPSLLDHFGSAQSAATGINNSGQVSGSTVNPGWDVARWDLAVSHTPTVLNTQGYTMCISSTGAVGGNAYFGAPGGCTYASVFPLASGTTVSNTECANSSVTSINASGYAVGRGYLGSNKGFFAAGPGYAAHELVNFAGVTGPSFYTAANAVNDSGQVAGYVHHPTLGSVAIIFKDLNGNGIAEPATEYTILSTPAAGSCNAHAINNEGVAGGVRASDDGGMLWLGGKEIFLNQSVTKDASGYPWIRSVVDINEAGQILCKATTAGGEQAVILTPTCYPNCDGSNVSPMLNANDFQCFLNRFAVSSIYTNCDDSTAAPILNVNDFSCFMNKFAVGCT